MSSVLYYWLVDVTFLDEYVRRFCIVAHTEFQAKEVMQHRLYGWEGHIKSVSYTRECEA